MPRASFGWRGRARCSVKAGKTNLLIVLESNHPIEDYGRPLSLEYEMEIFFADDSGQRTCNRGDMGPLVSVGGGLVHEAAIQPLAGALDNNAAKFGPPRGDELKGCPHRGCWLRETLHYRPTDCEREAL